MNLFLQTDLILKKLSTSKRVSSITFIIAVLEQSISPILPEMYVALILSYRKDLSWKMISFVSACGSTVGALLTYSFGAVLFSSFGERLIAYFSWQSSFEAARAMFGENILMAQFIAALTPIPDRVFSLFAGAFTVAIPLFLLGAFLGRYIRILIVAYCAHRWGGEARDIIKKHTKVAMIVGSTLCILYVWFMLMK